MSEQKTEEYLDFRIEICQNLHQNGILRDLKNNNDNIEIVSHNYMTFENEIPISYENNALSTRPRSVWHRENRSSPTLIGLQAEM